MKKPGLMALILAAAVGLSGCGETAEESAPERVREDAASAVYEEPDEGDADTGEADAGEPDAGEAESDSKEADPRLAGRANADTGKGTPKELKEGDAAPDFTADLAGGGTFTLSDHDDEVVLINFWATWCPPCVGEMPAFEKLKNDKIDGFSMVAVNCAEDKGSVDKFIKDNGYSFNIGYDSDYRIGTYYPTDGIPYTVIVDHGIISKIYVGAGSADVQYKEYKRAIEDALK